MDSLLLENIFYISLFFMHLKYVQIWDKTYSIW